VSPASAAGPTCNRLEGAIFPSLLHREAWRTDWARAAESANLAALSVTRDRRGWAGFASGLLDDIANCFGHDFGALILDVMSASAGNY